MELLDLPLEVILCISDHLEYEADIWSFAHISSHFHQPLTRQAILRFSEILIDRAITHDWEDLLRKIFQAPIDINMELQFCGLTPLVLAIHKGRAVMAGVLLQNPNLDIHRKRPLDTSLYGMVMVSPLQEATFRGESCIMRLLLSHSHMDVAHASEAVCTAIYARNAKALEILLQHDVDPNQYTDDGSLLAYAVRHWYTPAVHLLVADRRTDLDIIYQESESKYGAPAPQREPVPIILELMRHLDSNYLTVLWNERARFATPEILDDDGNTALHLMADRGHLQWCQTLLEEFPEMLFVTNNAGDMPLSIALRYRLTDVCDLFCRHNAACYQTPDVNGEVPLMDVIRTGYLELLQKLQLHEPLKEQLCHSQGKDGATPLTKAIMHRQHGIVECLIQLGVDPNIADEAGYTPLIFAVKQKNVKIVEALLNSSNLDLNKHDTLGWNALVWARWPQPKSRRRHHRKAHKKIERMLVARGANLGLLLDNAEWNKRPSGWRMWRYGPGKVIRRQTLISDA